MMGNDELAEEQEEVRGGGQRGGIQEAELDELNSPEAAVPSLEVPSLGAGEAEVRLTDGEELVVGVLRAFVCVMSFSKVSGGFGGGTRQSFQKNITTSSHPFSIMLDFIKVVGDGGIF